MAYVYNDEDNAPMNDFDDHNPTAYTGVYESRMMDKYGEPEPQGKPADGCWNCRNYDWTREACTKNWNNFDDCYYSPDLDDHDPTSCCEDHDLDPDVKPEDWDFGGNEP